MPLSLVGDTAKEMSTWIEQAQDQILTPIYMRNSEAEEVLLGQGYETTRPCSALVDGHLLHWRERVLVVYSQTYAKMLISGVEQRLATATAKLMALTPPRSRGKRQIKEETSLRQAAQAILDAHRVDGLLDYHFERQVEYTSKNLGRGRGGPKRPQQVVERVRYQITAVIRQESAITCLEETLGWRAYATNMPAERLALEAAVLSYREEWIIERGFHRLKGAPLSLYPLFVKRDDQVIGLIHLLSLAVRLLTLIEFVARRTLEREQASLVGLHSENPKKATMRPTTERLLQAFSSVTLTIIGFADRVVRHVTPLSALQVRILETLELSPDIYRSLADNSI